MVMATQTSRTRTQSTRRRTSGSAANRRAEAPSAPVQINTEDIAQLEAGRMLVVSQLDEALGAELAGVTTMRAHAAMTPEGPYRKLLERHLSETRAQADRLRTRLDELGATRSPVAVGYAAASTVVGQALALTKGPIDVLRGRAGEEKLLKNAKDEITTEAQEIATYDAIEATARAVGDIKTAELAVAIRGQEEAQLAKLREALVPLANATVRSLAAGDKSYDVSTTGAAQAALGLRDEVAEEVEELGDEVKGQARKAQRTTQRTTRRTTQRAAAKARA